MGAKSEVKVCSIGRRRCPPSWKCRGCGRRFCEHFIGSKDRTAKLGTCASCNRKSIPGVLIGGKAGVPEYHDHPSHPEFCPRVGRCPCGDGV